jgi:hypothetical protein
LKDITKSFWVILRLYDFLFLLKTGRFLSELGAGAKEYLNCLSRQPPRMQ